MSIDPLKQILLVEDEVLITLAEAGTIRSFGYEVILAHTGKQAVSIAGSSQQIDLILMDIDLGPGMDGAQAAQEILAHRQVPIVFLTSHAEHQTVAKVKGITRYGYVIKYSGNFVLQSSIEMAFELFEAHQKQLESEKRYQTLAETVTETTNRKEMDIVLPPNAEISTDIINSLSTSLVVLDEEGVIIAVNQAWKRFARENGAIEQTTGIGMNYLDVCHKAFAQSADPSALTAAHGIRSVIDGSQTYFEFEYPCNSPAEQRWFNMRVTLIVGARQGVVISHALITHRKQLEQELTEYQKAIEDSPDIIAVIDQDYVYRLVNQAFLDSRKLRRTAVIGQHAEQVLGRDYFLRNLKPYIDRCLQGETIEFESVSTYPELGQRNLLVTYSPLRIGGETVNRVVANIRDFTEYNGVEAELRASQSKLADAMEIARLVQWEYDLAENVFILNDPFYALYGTSIQQEGSYRMSPEAYVLNFVHPEDIQLVVDVMQQASRVDSDTLNYQLKHRILRRDGAERFIQVHIRLIKDDQGRLLRLYGVNQDITGRKQAEEALREKQAQLDLVLRSVEMGAWRLEFADQRRYFDDQTCHLLGIDPATFQGTTEEFYERVHPDDVETLKIELNRMIEQVGLYQPEYRAVWKDGSIHHIAARARLYKDELGRPMRLNGVVWDVTERKQAEREIKKLLEEKELLLREVHHRIKNNMNTVHSLLALQASTLEESAAVDALQDASGRVLSMMTIYDRLYRSDNYDQINLQDYLEALIDEIATSWQSSQHIIDIEKEIEAIEVPIKLSFPLGIIINELMTNAYKYAFPKIRSGRIHITVHRLDDNLVNACVFNDGVGLPAEIDIHNPQSFGLNLVKLMAQQMEGSFQVSRNGGTSFSLVFPYSVQTL